MTLEPVQKDSHWENFRQFDDQKTDGINLLRHLIF